MFIYFVIIMIIINWIIVLLEEFKESSIETIFPFQKNYSILKGLYSIVPIIYDTLFKMDEYRGELASDNDVELLRIQDLFQFFSSDFPYKIRSIFLLSEIGNYADAGIIEKKVVSKQMRSS